MQKIERSDSNDILGTYFRPRRAAELIHQNKVLNTWKDYKKPNLLSNWTAPALLVNGTTNSNPMSWQPIPCSAAVKSVRNGNTSPRKTLDDLKNKPFYGVRPSLNVTFNSNTLTSDSNKPLNYHPHNLNETGGSERSLSSMRSPFMPATFMRDNFGWQRRKRSLKHWNNLEMQEEWGHESKAMDHWISNCSSRLQESHTSLSFESFTTMDFFFNFWISSIIVFLNQIFVTTTNLYSDEFYT